MFELKVQKFFSAAHHLLNYDGECEKPHGHNWKVEVYLQGANLDRSSILFDFKIFKARVNDVLKKLDHEDINELPMFKGVSPSSEILAKYIYDELKNDLPLISKVSVWETEDNCASYFEE